MGHHHHEHHHQPKFSSYNRNFFIATSVNFLFVIAQIIAALYANSMGLLADALHNFGDVLGLGFAWISHWLLTKNSTHRYSYGYKKTTILAAMANALLLVATSAVIGFESIQKMFSPQPIVGQVVILVAILGTLVNASTALLFMKDRHHDLNVKGAFLHLAADALLSMGVAVSGVIIYFTDWWFIDSVVGLILVFTILIGTWRLLRDSVNLILDAVPHNVDYRAVYQYLSNLTGVTEVHDLHIWAISTSDTALTAHLVMPNSSLKDDDYQHINHELLDKFNIGHVTLQIEAGNLNERCGQASIC